MATSQRRNRSDGLWYKCEVCNELRFGRKLARNLMVCSKCGYHFPIRAANLLKNIFDKDEFVRIKSKSNLATVGRLILDDYQAIAIAIDNPQMDKDSIHESECLAFTDAASISIKERIPFISIYAPLETQLTSLLTTSKSSIQSEIVSLADTVNRLSDKHIPHITVLANANPGDDFTTYFPIGDIVIADNPLPKLDENSAKTGTSQNGIQTNKLDSSELLIDMRVDRKELADILEKLVIFFSQ